MQKQEVRRWAGREWLIMLKIEQMVQAKLTTTKQANWGEKQVTLTLSAGHTITLGGVNQYFIYLFSNPRKSLCNRLY